MLGDLWSLSLSMATSSPVSAPAALCGAGAQLGQAADRVRAPSRP